MVFLRVALAAFLVHGISVSIGNAHVAGDHDWAGGMNRQHPGRGLGRWPGDWCRDMAASAGSHAAGACLGQPASPCVRIVDPVRQRAGVAVGGHYRCYSGGARGGNRRRDSQVANFAPTPNAGCNRREVTGRRLRCRRRPPLPPAVTGVLPPRCLRGPLSAFGAVSDGPCDAQTAKVTLDKSKLVCWLPGIRHFHPIRPA